MLERCPSPIAGALPSADDRAHPRGFSAGSLITDVPCPVAGWDPGEQNIGETNVGSDGLPQAFYQRCQDVLSRFLGGSAGVALGTISNEQGRLFPGEERLVSGAARKRISEFTAGRTLARHAMSRLGLDAAPLLADGNGCPEWPRGITGSISHSGSACLAAVCSTEVVESLGVDIETSFPQNNVYPYICTPNELLQISCIDQPAERVQLIFSAKESFFKCYYQTYGRFIGFEAAEVTGIEEGGSAGSFAVHLVSSGGAGEKPQRFPGVWIRHHRTIVTAVLQEHGGVDAKPAPDWR